jgi:hypothetical protein
VQNKYFDITIIYYCMFVLDSFTLYNILLVQLMVYPEKCNGERIIETLLLPSMYSKFLHIY